jgi:hypothetical protein
MRDYGYKVSFGGLAHECADLDAAAVRLLAARSGGHQARVVRCESLTRQRPLTCEEQAELVERAATLAPVFA